MSDGVKDQLSKTDSKLPNLAGLGRDRLRALFTEFGEKPFHADQVLKWVHQRGITDLDSMTDISKSLREKLKTKTQITLPVVVDGFLSEDGTRKWIVEVASGSRVEMVFIPEAARGTLCISSQAGCSLDCSFLCDWKARI